MTTAASDISRLYREAVLDHSRHPRNFRRIEPSHACAEGNNPLCGDRIHVYLRFDGDRLTDAAFEATGCAISLASASMMTEAVRGRSIDEAREAIARAHALFADPATAVAPGELAALASVRNYPSRVRCALLPWRTLEAALGHSGKLVSTE